MEVPTLPIILHKRRPRVTETATKSGTKRDSIRQNFTGVNNSYSHAIRSCV